MLALLPCAATAFRNGGAGAGAAGLIRPAGAGIGAAALVLAAVGAGIVRDTAENKGCDAARGPIGARIDDEVICCAGKDALLASFNGAFETGAD